MSTPGSEAYRFAIAEVTKVYQDTPNGGVLLSKIAESFEKQYTNPPTSIFEALIGKVFTSEEVRCILFRPAEEQARYYPVILQVTRDLPDDRKCEQRTRLTILSLIYLVHRKSWSFLREFVIYGGLTEISYMINSSNHYYRGQAFEILLSITDCDTFDWFQPHAGNQTVRSLHIQLLGLSKNIYFLSGLLENRMDSYPGGSFRALQLLAFWLSWVRAMVTKNHILYLSARTLQELKFWTKGYGLTNNNTEEEHNADRGVDEDEIKLAQTLYKDFSYEQFHRDSSGDINLESEKHFMNSMENLCIETRTSIIFTDEERAEIFVSGFDESFIDESNGNSNSSCNNNSNGNSNNNSSNGNNSHSEVNKTEDPPISTPLTTASGVHIEEQHLDGSAVDCAVTGNASHDDVLITEAMPVAVSEEPYNRVKHVESLIDEARSLKEEGNRYFKLSQYANCVTPYENAIAEIESGLEACQLQPSDEVLTEETADSLLTLKLECEELLASLHYNKATAYWKLSELDAAPHTTAEQHSNSVSTYLDLCKSYCTIAISINPRHSKSIYRLCEALLREGNSTEALAVIEEHSKLCALNDLLKSLRRKCLAAFLIIQGPDDYPNPSSTSSLTSTSLSVMTASPIDQVKKGIRSNGREQFANESESLSEVTYTRPKSHSFTETIQCADDNARTCVDVSTGADVVVKTVGSRAAKVLKQLQARESRENAHNDHAYNGFTVPIESPSPHSAAQDGDNIVMAAHYSDAILHTNVIHSDGECVENVRHHGKDESERRMKKKSSKIHISAISTDKSIDKMKDKKEKKGVIDKSKEREEKKKKSKEKHRGEDRADGEDGGCVKNEEGSIGVAESFQRLRKLSLLFDMTFDKALVISNASGKNCKSGSKGGVTVPVSDVGGAIGDGRVEGQGDNEVNGEMIKGRGRSRSRSQTQQSDVGQDGEEALDPVLKDLFDVLDGHVHSAVEHLQNIWKEGMTLKKVMGTGSVMEAEFLHFLVTIAIKYSISCIDDTSKDESHLNIAARLLRELIKVERFGTVFHLIVHGKKVFRSCIDHTLDTILVHVQRQIAASKDTQESNNYSEKHLKEIKKLKSENEKSVTMITLLKSSLHR